MNNKEYIFELSQRCGYTQDNTQKYVRCIIEKMASKFDNGENVFIPNFGTFELKNRMERIVVNPSTGQRMMVPPKIVLNFKPVASIKEKLRKSENE
jgi:DNA-binding protein HU-beta